MSCFDNINAFRESKRYLRKENTAGIRDVYADLWKNYINLYGVQTSYYRHGYNLATQDDFLYGEDPTESFYNPKSINMIVQYQTDAILLSKFGIESTSDLTAIVSIKDYEDNFGIGIEPKAGDIIELTEASWVVEEMNPSYDTLKSSFNIVDSNLSSYSIVSGIDLDSVDLFPIKELVFEDELSYFTKMYTAVSAVEVIGYPIDQPLYEVSGSLASSYYLRLQVGSEYYFTPLYVPAISITAPNIHALYFQHDIVDLNGEDIESAGYFPFEYNNIDYFMPVYRYSASGTPLSSATVIVSADPLSMMKYSTKQLLCMYRDAGYVSSIKMGLTAIYGSRYIRCPQLFEITEVKYQDFSQPGINFAQGHYVWLIHAKRFEYSFEPGLSGIPEIERVQNHQVYDSSFAGILSASYAPSSDSKLYIQNIEMAGADIWDYEDKGTDTNPYGYY